MFSHNKLLQRRMVGGDAGAGGGGGRCQRRREGASGEEGAKVKTSSGDSGSGEERCRLGHVDHVGGGQCRRRWRLACEEEAERHGGEGGLVRRTGRPSCADLVEGSFVVVGGGERGRVAWFQCGEGGRAARGRGRLSGAWEEVAWRIRG